MRNLAPYPNQRISDENLYLIIETTLEIDSMIVNNMRKFIYEIETNKIFEEREKKRKMC